MEREEKEEEVVQLTDHGGGVELEEREEEDRNNDNVALADCKKCSKKVIKDALQCDMCDWWIHFECEGMKRSEYNFFGRKTDALWFCSECTVEFRKRKEPRLS